MAMSELLLSGAELMLLGMGIVFIFLTILVFSLKGMCTLANWLEDEEEQPEAAPAMSVTDAGAAEPAVVAAISAAISRFRAAHR